MSTNTEVRTFAHQFKHLSDRDGYGSDCRAIQQNASVAHYLTKFFLDSF